LTWLSGWSKRIAITIDKDDISSTLTWFPILVYLSAASGIGDVDVSAIFDEVGADSLKIAITKSDGTTELYVEIEKWDSSGEEAWLWVSRDGWEISSSVDTVLYIYYDSSHADNNSYVGVKESTPAMNVWDGDFLMVQHMNDASTPIKDSTTNNEDMSETGDPAYQQSGKINDAVDYDGSDDHYTVFSPFDAIVTAGVGTIGLWVKTSVTTGDHYLFSIEGAYAIVFLHVDSDGKPRCFWSGSGSDYCKPTTAINDGEWHYIVTVYDGANQIVYIDGGSEHTDACNLYDVIGLPNRRARICAQHEGSDKLIASIDSVRVSKVNRSTAWINANNENMRDDLLTFGSEEVLGASSSSIVPIMQGIGMI